jgi:hypothetical protein
LRKEIHDCSESLVDEDLGIRETLTHFGDASLVLREGVDVEEGENVGLSKDLGVLSFLPLHFREPLKPWQENTLSAHRGLELEDLLEINSFEVVELSEGKGDRERREGVGRVDEFLPAAQVEKAFETIEVQH